MTVIYFLATILLLVAVHEWGHFIMARLFGVGVRSFTIGFGKQCIAWQDQKTGTSWGIAPFPLGGYVGLLGEKNNHDGSHEPHPLNRNKIAIAVQGKPFVTAPLHAKLLILFAGPCANIVLAAMLYAGLAYTAPNLPLPVLAKPWVGSPAELAGLQSGDRLRLLNGQKMQNWHDVQRSLLDLKSGETIAVTIERQMDDELKIRSMSLVSTTSMVKRDSEKTSTERLGLQLATQGLLINDVLPNTAAAQAGVQLGDVMQTLDGVVIDSPDVLFRALKRYDVQLNQPLVFTVLRNHKILTLSITPFKSMDGAFKIGVQFAGIFSLTVQKLTLLDALNSGVLDAYTAAHLTLQAFGRFLLKPLTSNELGGPISIAKVAKSSVDQGWSSTLAFLASLSISIGVLNLLPIPMLDGGQILYHLGAKILRVGGLTFKIQDRCDLKNFNIAWNYLGLFFVFFVTFIALATDFRPLF
jgi:regulator of sigma E protease